MKKVFIFGLGVLLWSCGQGGSSDSAYDSVVAVEEAVAFSPSSERGSPEHQAVAVTEQKIIKNGTLGFETPDLEKTTTQIYEAVKKYKAHIQHDSQGKNYNSFYRTITIRVPSHDFENLVQQISSGVAYFDTKEIASQDVTERYIDLQARLRAKTKLENRYLELLQKATKVSELLEIEKELSAIREEIEAQQAQLNYLQNQVSMSTLLVNFYKPTAHTGVTSSYGSKMWNAIKSGVQGISSFFLGLLHIWPFIILLTGLVYILRKRIRNRKKQ